jgi:hypothetical protein
MPRPTKPEPICLENAADHLEYLAACLRATHRWMVEDDSDDLAPPHRPARKVDKPLVDPPQFEDQVQ